MTDTNTSTTTAPPPTVPVGPTTIAGTGISIVAFVLAIVAFVTGHHDEQTLGTITAGVIGLVTGGLVLLGRYLQARELVKPRPVIVAPPAPAPARAVADTALYRTDAGRLVSAGEPTNAAIDGPVALPPAHDERDLDDPSLDVPGYSGPTTPGTTEPRGAHAGLATAEDVADRDRELEREGAPQ